MKAIDIMTKSPFSLLETDTIKYAAEEFRKRKIDGAPVINKGGKLVGLFTKGHLMDAISIGYDNTVPIRQLMTTKVMTAPEDTPKEDIWLKQVGRMPVVDADNKLTGIITRTDLVKAFFRDSEQSYNKLKAILQSLYNGILAVNKEGVITIFNPAAERISGVAAEEAIGKLIGDIVPETGLLETLHTGEYQYGQQISFGNSVAVSNRAPIMENGQVIGAVAVLQDISDLEKISAELKLSKELNAELDTIIDSVYDGLYITDGQGVTTRINKSYTRMTGIRPEEVIGRNVQELEDRGWYTQVVTPIVLKKKQPETIMHTIRGEKRCLITGNPVFDEQGRITKVVTNVRDITELINLKEKLDQSEELTRRYHLELELLRQQHLNQLGVVGQSMKMKQVLELALRAAQVDATVLLLGETGVGKGVISKEIHKNSSRAKCPFIEVNCAAIPENLLESELFGYEKGAFTGALVKGKPGLFELADSGTILLDEIGELPINLQAKLLHVIQQKQVTRIGGTNAKELDIRIIAATNRDLDLLVAQGQFREDLYYRLNVLPIRIPPLRSRGEDIPLLSKHFLDVFNNKYNTEKQFDLLALEALTHYSWPGNIRELENFIERLVVIINDKIITYNHLISLLDKDSREILPQMTNNEVSLDEAVSTVEKQLITKALSAHGSTRKAAKALKVSQPTIVRKAKKYGIPPSL